MRTAAPGLLVAIALLLGATSGCTPQGGPRSERRVVSDVGGQGTAFGALVFHVPDAKDGQSNRNPPGTVEVFSPAEATSVLTFHSNTPQNQCNAAALYADVRIKNYATEQLGNVIVEFTGMNPTSHTICNPAPSPGLDGVSSTIGLIGYGNLDGSAVSDGSAPGGISTQTWWINYQESSPFTFSARVWADVTPAPPSGPSPAAGTIFCAAGQSCGSSLTAAPASLSWTGSTPDGYVEIATDAAFATTIEAALVTGTANGSGGYSFAYEVASATAGTRYWRAVNRFQQGGSGPFVNGTFSTGGSYFQDAAPVNLAAAYVQFYKYSLSGDSPAPRLDFYSWNWSNPPYYTWTEQTQFSFYDQYTLTPPTHRVESFEPTHLVSGEPGKPTIHWRACTQHGTAYAASTQGACANGPDYTVP